MRLASVISLVFLFSLPSSAESRTDLRLREIESGLVKVSTELEFLTTKGNGNFVNELTREEFATEVRALRISLGKFQKLVSQVESLPKSRLDMLDMIIGEKHVPSRAGRTILVSCDKHNWDGDYWLKFRVNGVEYSLEFSRGTLGREDCDKERVRITTLGPPVVACACHKSQWDGDHHLSCYEINEDLTVEKIVKKMEFSGGAKGRSDCNEEAQRLRNS